MKRNFVNYKIKYKIKKEKIKKMFMASWGKKC